MENKVLIKLNVPELASTFDIFIPVNEVMWKIKMLILKSISDLTSTQINNNVEYIMINKDNCRIYSNNEIVINTDIRNGTELIMITKL